MGTREVGNAEKDARFAGDVLELAEILRAAGLDDTRLDVRIEEGATHTEAAWARRFPEALEFLFSEIPLARARQTTPATDSPLPRRKV
jgi:hypothetical protein